MSVAFHGSLSDGSLVHLSGESWKSHLGEYHCLGAFIVSPISWWGAACRCRLLQKWALCCSKFFSGMLPLLFLNKISGINQPRWVKTGFLVQEKTPDSYRTNYKTEKSVEFAALYRCIQRCLSYLILYLRMRAVGILLLGLTLNLEEDIQSSLCATVFSQATWCNGKSGYSRT